MNDSTYPKSRSETSEILKISEVPTNQNDSSQIKGFILAAALGAIGGGLFVALATRAIPKIMSQMMPAMMQNMMGQMNQCGLNPAEM